MFHDAILYMQYNTATLAERKKAQNKLNKTGHVSEMQVALDILRFRFCLIKLTIRKIIPHAHELQLELLFQYCSGTIHSTRTPK